MRIPFRELQTEIHFSISHFLTSWILPSNRVTVGVVSKNFSMKSLPPWRVSVGCTFFKRGNRWRVVTIQVSGDDFFMVVSKKGKEGMKFKG